MACPPQRGPWYGDYEWGFLPELSQHPRKVGVCFSQRSSIGANKRVGRVIARIVRCLLSDSGLPKFLWGELVQMAVYLSNRFPHKAFYGKGAYVGNVRVVGAKAFVHVKTHIKT